jgi:hypothetical protein
MKRLTSNGGGKLTTCEGDNLCGPSPLVSRSGNTLLIRPRSGPAPLTITQQLLDELFALSSKNLHLIGI